MKLNADAFNRFPSVYTVFFCILFILQNRSGKSTHSAAALVSLLSSLVIIPALSRLLHIERPAFVHSSGHVAFVADNVALKLVFTQCFYFPCQFSFHQLLHVY
jgi:hypothetical protein